MSISVILDTFKGTIDMAIREFAKVAAAKVCELIDEKKEDLWGFIECNQTGLGFDWWYFPNQHGFFHDIFIDILQK